MSVKEIEKQVVKIIHNHLGYDVKIYLFGSQARGRAQPASDIDIAVDLKHGSKNTKNKFSFIRTEIDTLRTLRKIDVIDLSLTKRKFKDHIFKYAIPL